MSRPISSPKGKQLAVTADDRLWLARAVEAEGAPRDLVAQVLVNRWAWLADEHPGLYPTLTSLVRAYAQPVNPRWYPTGDLFAKRLERAPEDERDALRAQAERREAVHSARTTFSARTDAAVTQALQGPITIPAGALHFAAGWVNRPDLPILVRGSATSNTIYGEARGRGIGALYAFDDGGPSFPRAQLLTGRPHAVIAFLFLTAGGLLGLRSLRRRRN